MNRNYEKFFTHSGTADFMVSLLKKPSDNFTALEPSAGSGAIIKSLRKAFGSAVEIHAVEKDNVWFDELNNMCEKVFIQDFLEYYSSFPYDVCVANPPFGNGIDLQAHFDNICELVKDGGQIIMIVPENFIPDIPHETIPLENWSKNNDGTTTPIKIINFINPTTQPPSNSGDKNLTAMGELIGLLKSSGLFNINDKKIAELLAKERDDKKKEAMAFAEWALDQGWRRFQAMGKMVWCDESEYEWMGEQNRLVTTEQLYNLFHQHL